MSFNNHLKHDLKNWILIIVGSFSVSLGVLGIFLPLLPTTPFLLLAAACYIRSSKRFYNWLINNKWLGSHVRNYREGNGIPLLTKITAISILWLTIGYSVVFVIPVFIGKAALLLIAVGVTIHLLSIKTLKRNYSASEKTEVLQVGNNEE